MASKKPIKCLDCGKKCTSPEALYEHIEKEHHDLIPPDFTPARYHYMKRTGKREGRCVEDHAPTPWNPVTNKYARFCGKKSCRDAAAKRAADNLMRAKNVTRSQLLNDADMQKKMLANRKISGKYKWSDGTEKVYTGKYELNTLEALDKLFGFPSADVITPSPNVYSYTYEGKEHFYFPDIFIPSVNLEIEDKDGGDNPNMHPKIQAVDKVKEKLKEEAVIKANKHNYLKIVNNNNWAILKMIEEINYQMENSSNDEQKNYIFMLDDSKSKVMKPSPILESLFGNDEDTGNDELMSIVQESTNSFNLVQKINQGSGV